MSQYIYSRTSQATKGLIPFIKTMPSIYPTLKESDRKYIRTQKALIRRQFLDMAKQEEMISDLYKKLLGKSVAQESNEVKAEKPKTEVKAEKPKAKTEVKKAKQKKVTVK